MNIYSIAWTSKATTLADSFYFLAETVSYCASRAKERNRFYMNITAERGTYLIARATSAR